MATAGAAASIAPTLTSWRALQAISANESRSSSGNIAQMVPALWLLADAAEEGKVRGMPHSEYG